MWIEIKDKNQYMDSSIRGLRLRFYSEANSDLKKICKDFCRWLRKRYWFPIRCTVTFKKNAYFSAETKNDKDSVADFYYSSNNEEKILPEIWIATGKTKTCKVERLKNEIGKILGSLAHELTHYFQWYFFEFEKRTDRSLEIEAGKWASYLVDEFLAENNI